MLTKCMKQSRAKGFTLTAVSYTHLDVYKRQIIDNANKLGRYLEKRGVQVIRARNDLYTDTHQIFISMKENEIMSGGWSSDVCSSDLHEGRSE